MSIIRYFNEPFESYITYIAGRMQMTYAEGFLCAIAFIVAILSALVLHEIAHGYIAYKNGDDTAKVMGRLTLNPVSHLDPIGTLCMLLVGFGWAKPVPVNPNNIQTRKGMLGVSVAGVITNLILSFLLFGIYYLIIALAYALQSALEQSLILYFVLYLLNCIAYFGAFLNLMFCLFNILPIYPLDGFRVLQIYCNPNSKFMTFMVRYSSRILLGLILLGYIGELFNAYYIDILGMYIQITSGAIGSVFNMFWTWILGGILPL